MNKIFKVSIPLPEGCSIAAMTKHIQEAIVTKLHPTIHIDTSKVKVTRSYQTR